MPDSYQDGRPIRRVNPGAGQNGIAADFDFKGPDRFGGRHAEGFAGADVEAGAVAGAGDFAAFERAVGERLAVVAADVFDGVEVGTDVEQKGGCFVDDDRFAAAGGDFVDGGDLLEFGIVSPESVGLQNCKPWEEPQRSQRTQRKTRTFPCFIFVSFEIFVVSKFWLCSMGAICSSSEIVSPEMVGLRPPRACPTLQNSTKNQDGHAGSMPHELAADSQLALYGAAQGFADGFDRNAIVDGVEKAFDNQVHGFELDSPRHMQ